MFLNRLKQKEKVAFLELAHYVARSDGNFCEEEESIIKTYCYEMQINNIDYSEEDFDIERVLSVFVNDSSQKVLLLELMALVYSDEMVTYQETEIINIICKCFDINDLTMKMYAEWTKTILAIAAQGQLLLEI